MYRIVRLRTGVLDLVILTISMLVQVACTQGTARLMLVCLRIYYNPKRNYLSSILLTR